MGQQLNKVIKRRRRQKYLRRLKDRRKAEAKSKPAA
jgi:hypothetical protein